MLFEHLKFGKFREIEDRIVEGIINEGVEICLPHFKQMEEAFLEKYRGPYALFVNRRNAYSHSLEVLQHANSYTNAVATAIITYSPISHMSAKVHELHPGNIRTFHDFEKEHALNWLRLELAKYL